MSETDDFEIEVDKNVDPAAYAPWFKQFLQLSEKKRDQVYRSAMEQLKTAKPDTYMFIKNFKCELVGISPRVEYALLNSRDGDLDVTWIHSFSGPTLLFWCPKAGFGFFVNANLRYNESVLNEVKGNKLERLRGFTG